MDASACGTLLRALALRAALPRSRVVAFLPLFALLVAFVALATLPALAPTPLHAQSRTTASLRGTVTSTDGALLQGASITVVHEPSGETRVGLSDAAGRFLLLQLRPGGPYRLTVQVLGFAERTVEGITLQVGDTRDVEIVLSEQAIDVEGLSVSIDRTSIFDASQVGPATRLDEPTIQAMPVMSRNVLELTRLSPLVRTTESGGFSIAGQNDRYNAVLVDGLLSKDMFGLTSGGVPGGQAGAKLIPIDAVAQYEILVAPFDVRLSGFSGGVMNAVTRSGTNDWRLRASGVHRNESLIGDLSLPSGPVEASAVDRSLLALSFGGPLVRDRAHIFAAAEFEQSRQPPDGFNLFRDPGSLIGISHDAIEAVAAEMESQFGLDVGEVGAYPLDRALANTFVRADLGVGDGDRLTLRHIFGWADVDQAPNRGSFRPYELGSNAVFRRSTSHLASLQYFREFYRGWANELDVTFQRIVDRTEPASDLPQIEVELESIIDGREFERAVRLGGQYFAQENDLEQTSLRITNSLDIPVDDEMVTLGVTGAWFGFRNAFLPGAQGEYFFGSLDDLRQNQPFRFQQSVLNDGEPDAVTFNVAEVGAFVQREVRAGDGLTMHFGLRADIPFVLDRPERNIDLEAFFGYNTSDLPSGHLLFSPRWGFNWQSEGERTTQVRGGAGLFTGQIPYVWLANAFHDNGLRSVNRFCEGRRRFVPNIDQGAPAFEPGSSPQSCVLSGLDIEAFGAVRNAVVFDPAFKYPQDIKFSTVVDRELGGSVTGSLGVFFNRALNQVGLQDLNVASGAAVDERMAALAGTDRRYYRQLGEEFQHILAVTNEGDNWAVAGTAELRGSLSERVAFQLGYSFARTWDRMSLVYTDMVSNFGTNPVVRDVNHPTLETSNFDRPHKLLATVFGAPIPGLPRTEISLLYTGQSGSPFTYVYEGDVNGDGYPGVGGASDRFNDPVYVPEVFPVPPVSLATYPLIRSALEVDECFGGEEGRQLQRNECRAPWEHQLDLRVAQTLELGATSVRLEADLLNVLSLIHGSWGRVQRTPANVPLMRLCRLECNGFFAPFPAVWTGGVLPAGDGSGDLVPTDPWTAVTPESQWRMQFGARVTFGGAGR